MSATPEDISRIIEIHAVERRRKPVRVAFAPNFAIGDDVEARPFLIAYGQNGRVVLRLLEPFGGDAPKFPARTRGGIRSLSIRRSISQSG